MKDDHAYSGAQLLISFFAGAATGAAVALLMAPQSGQESRSRIRGWARDAQGRAGRVPGALRVAFERAAHSAREAFSEALREEADSAKDG